MSEEEMLGLLRREWKQIRRNQSCLVQQMRKAQSSGKRGGHRKVLNDFSGGNKFDIQHNQFEPSHQQQQQQHGKYKSTESRNNANDTTEVVSSGKASKIDSAKNGVQGEVERSERQESSSKASTSSCKIIFNQFSKQQNKKEKRNNNNNEYENESGFSFNPKPWNDLSKLVKVAPFQSKLTFNLANPAISRQAKSNKEKSNLFAQARQATKFLETATEVVKLQQQFYQQDNNNQHQLESSGEQHQQQQSIGDVFDPTCVLPPAYLGPDPRSGVSQIGNCNRANLVGEHLEGTNSHSQEFSEIHSGNTAGNDQGDGRSDGSLRRFDGSSQGFVPNDVRQSAQSLLQGCRCDFHSNPELLHHSVRCPLFGRGDQASSPNHQGPTGSTLSPNSSQQESSAVGVVGLENSIKMGGHRNSHKRELRDRSSSPQKRSSDSLEESSQEHKSEAVSSNRNDGSEGQRQRSSVSQTPQISTSRSEAKTEALSKNNRTNGQVPQETQSGQADHGPQLQKSSNPTPHGSGSGLKSGSRSNSLGLETQKQIHSNNGKLHSLQQGQSPRGQSVGKSESNCALVEHKNNNNNGNVKSSSSRQTTSSSSSYKKNIKKQYDDMNYSLFKEGFDVSDQYNASPSKSKASFTRHSHNSKLPTSEQQQAVPLHSHDVSKSILDLEKIKSLMSDKYAKRLGYLTELVFKRFPQHVESQTRRNNNNNPFVESPPKQDYPVADAQKLVADGTATHISDSSQSPTKAFGIPFNVIEEKDGKLRRRFIFWTKAMNDFLEEVENYQPDLKNLKFQNYYLDSAADNLAVTGDLKISFFQVEIPESARQYFRFTDADGNIYQLTRLPMGLKVSPEIMQLIVECLAGLPEACKPSAKINGIEYDLQDRDGDVKVWIDGFANSYLNSNAANRAMERIKAIARYCKVTWKDPGVIIERKYDFVGVHFDHENHTVKVADKTLNKLPSASFVPKQSIKISELERLVSRLIFCSSVTRDILGKYFFLLKWSNRQIAKLNSSGIDSEVQLPATCTNLLNSWIKSSSKILHINKSNIKNEYDILFVDASNFGWGAYFVSSSGVVAIVGEKWNEEILQNPQYNINVLEAYAVELALKAFEERLNDNCNVDIRVDNTSSLFGILKSKSKSDNSFHNKHIVNVVEFLKSRNYEYTLQYVNTAENWADGPSRGKGDVVCPNPEQITAVLHSNRGTHGRQAATSSSVYGSFSNQNGLMTG